MKSMRKAIFAAVLTLVAISAFAGTASASSKHHHHRRHHHGRRK